MTQYPKIDPEFKARWVAALLSGDYKQGKGALRTDEGGVSSFCCLGVACDLIDPDAWHEDAGMPYDNERGWGGFGSGDTYQLPFMPDEMEEVSYDEDGDEIRPAHILLANLNDGNSNPTVQMKRRRSFREIARWIDKNL